MNNPNHWLNEQMVKYEMQEIDRAIAQARLLKEAGLSNESLLARAIATLRNLLSVRKKGVSDHESSASRGSQPAHEKLLEESSQ